MSNITFLEDWKEEQYRCLSRLNPLLTKNQIMEVLEEDIKENFHDPNSMIHNDYAVSADGKEMIIKQPLSTIYRFCKEKKPILAGNGTLFYNQDSHYSPIADLIDERIKARKEYQRIRDTFPPDSEEYQYYEMLQMEAKVRINSIYGSFGAPSFQLYNRYTAASTTGTAQSLISTTGIAFEAFIGNHVKFKSLGECIWFMTNIVNEEYHLPEMNIKKIHSAETVYKAMVDNFFEDTFDNESMGDIIMEFLMNCSVEDLTKIYYKNNIYEFVKNKDIKNMLISAFNKMDSFNNPNEVPDVIEDDMSLLWEYVSEYVFYNHSYTQRIDRLKHDKRSIVKLIDTDSNLVHVQPWVNFMDEEIIPNTKEHMDEDTTMFACVNTLAYLVTKMLRSLLDNYCDSCHVLERYWKRINMKNEFCFAKLLLASVKKRYVAKIILREGKPIVKTEIKGMDFKKASVTEFVNKRMTGIINDRILQGDTVDIPGILSDLDMTEKEIYQSLHNGERKFLLRYNCKVQEAYKNPYSMPQVKSVLVWNYLFPNAEIMLPDKLDVVLMNIPNVKTIEPLKSTHPQEYQRLVDLLTGPIESFKKDGIKYLAIPNNIDGVPEFLRPYIDYDYISSRNINTFKPIIEALQFSTVGSSKIEHFSNVRRNTMITI